MNDDLQDNHQYGTIEYMGPGEMITDSNKNDKAVPLQKKDNPFTRSMNNAQGSGMTVDSIHRQYNPAVSYDPTEEDK